MLLPDHTHDHLGLCGAVQVLGELSYLFLCVIDQGPGCFNVFSADIDLHADPPCQPFTINTIPQAVEKSFSAPDGYGSFKKGAA